MTEQPTTYAAAGVDVEAGDRAVDLMKSAVGRAQRPEVLGGLGGFAGLFDASALQGMRHPVLATSTDGVGTKVAIAQAMGVHDTIGVDLVGMVVDDIVVCGAEPLFMTDYIACGKVVPERVASLVAGIAHGCEQAGVALVGGETAEHPGLLEPAAYDLAGAATGVVERDQILSPERITSGDMLIAIASSGLHSNGYSLVRHIVSQAGWDWDRHVPDLGRTIGVEALEPTRIYSRLLLDLIAAVDVHGLSHVTGGGLAANVARVLPPGLVATIDRSTWTPPRIFTLLQELGHVPQQDLERTLNMGVGFVAAIDAADADRALAHIRDAGVCAWALGEVRAADSDSHPAGTGEDNTEVVQGAKGVDGGAVRMVSAHPTR